MNDLLVRGGDLRPPALNAANKPAAPEQGQGKSFSDLLQGAVEDINKLQTEADEAIARVQLDNTASIHEAVVALEKAGISFQAMMQVRNKIVDAYQEIMRIQV